MKSTSIALVMLSLLLHACSEKDPIGLPTEKMTEEWCEQMMVKPNNEWIETEIQLFARDCTYADQE